MKLNTIILVAGIMTALIVLPVLIAFVSPDMKAFFIEDAFGDIRDNEKAMEIADTFFLILGLISIGIVILVFGALKIPDIESKKLVCLLLGILLFFFALPDFIGVIQNKAHAPYPIMAINTIVFISLFYGWKKGVE